VKLFRIALLISTFSLSGCANNSELLGGLGDIAGQVAGQSGGALSIADISAGLKQALTVGSGEVVSQLGQQNGFNADPLIRIPLPNALVSVRDVAAKVGLDSSFNTLENRLNEAFVNSIRQMTLQDAQGILQGPDDAATSFFRRTMGGQLSDAMRPIIDDSLSQVGAVRGFQQLLASYRQIPFAPPVEADLTAHVLEKGLDGVWHYMAEEEAAIRQNPVKRTTDLLRRVFGSVARESD